jgi:hypothetical protein
MFSSLRLISFAREASRAAREATAQRLSDATRETSATSTLFAPTSPGVWNGGDLIWRAESRDDAHHREAEQSERFRAGTAALGDPSRVSLVEHVVFARGVSGGRSPRRGLYRVALFCANREPSAERLARFASETRAMPAHVTSIRRWQLAAPRHASGSRAWTHVWEQEYDDLAGLVGPYMLHPCHWGQVDRWFDPEDPDWLIDPLLCHSFCETSAPVIGHAE